MAARNNGSATRNSSNVHVELRCEMGASPSRSVASGLTLCPPLVAPLARRGLQPLSPSRSRSSSCEFDQAAKLQRALDQVKKACHCRLLTSRRPRQCSTPRGRTVARTCPEKATRSWWQAGFVLLRLIALSEGHPRWKQQPLLACSSWIFESSRRHGARTPPGSVVPRCVHHASARWGAEPSRTRSNPAHGALDPSKDCVNAYE